MWETVHRFLEPEWRAKCSQYNEQGGCGSRGWGWARLDHSKGRHSVCPTLCNPMDKCSPPGSSVHGILQARMLEWVAISFSRGSSRPRDQTQVSHIAGRRFNLWTTRKALDYIKLRHFTEKYIQKILEHWLCIIVKNWLERYNRLIWFLE